ncbi:MAG: tRNA lysidine(34) synthetase TilS, partial [Methylococcales bacterium]
MSAFLFISVTGDFMFAAALSEHLASALTQIQANAHIYVGYSGGVDSHVLLHLCAAYKKQHKITAVYIHHGLQAEAEAWAQHCQGIADELGVGFLMLRVNAWPQPGQSPEEGARNARYSALKALLAEGDVLMLAQHREDQLETVLLQLFRGSGLRGLSGMPEAIGFGKGLMLRPLLSASKQSLVDYAQAKQLRWVEDPSNQSNDYDRNFLRNAVLPLIKQRWPACDKTVARAATHCADAQVLLNELAEQLFAGVFNPAQQTLQIPELLKLPMSKQQLVIREWFQALGLKMPAQAFVQRILQEVIAAQPGRDPVLAGQGYALRRYRQHLYCVLARGNNDVQDTLWP